MASALSVMKTATTENETYDYLMFRDFLFPAWKAQGTLSPGRDECQMTEEMSITLCDHPIL